MAATLERNVGLRKTPRPGRKSSIVVTGQMNDDIGTTALPQSGRIEPELRDHIGRQLRAVYDEILTEPVPDRFLKLLADLQNKRDGDL